MTQLVEDVGLLWLMLEKISQWFILYQCMQHICLQGFSVQSPLRHSMAVETKRGFFPSLPSLHHSSSVDAISLAGYFCGFLSYGIAI